MDLVAPVAFLSDIVLLDVTIALWVRFLSGPPGLQVGGYGSPDPKSSSTWVEGSSDQGGDEGLSLDEASKERCCRQTGLAAKEKRTRRALDRFGEIGDGGLVVCGTHVEAHRHGIQCIRPVIALALVRTQARIRTTRSLLDATLRCSADRRRGLCAEMRLPQIYRLVLRQCLVLPVQPGRLGQAGLHGFELLPIAVIPTQGVGK